MTPPAATAASWIDGSHLHVRLDDPADAALFFNTLGRGYGLRELAPGVLAAAAEPEELLQLLQELGHRPTVEDNSGRARTVPTELRARTPIIRSTSRPGSAAAAARKMLAGDAAGAAADELAQATREARPVHVAYVSSDGSPAERVEATDLAAGTVRSALTGRAHRWSAFRSPAFRRCGRCRHRRYRLGN